MAGGSTLSLWGADEKNLTTPPGLAIVFQRVPVELSGQNGRTLEISSPQVRAHCLYQQGQAPLDLLASKATTVKPLCTLLELAGIMRDAGNNMVH